VCFAVLIIVEHQLFRGRHVRDKGRSDFYLLASLFTANAVPGAPLQFGKK
jgi:hypothetical protein